MSWKTGDATRVFDSGKVGMLIMVTTTITPTPFSGAWGPLEVALAGVSSKLANEVATNHYDPSHIKPLLDQANQQIQGQLH